MKFWFKKTENLLTFLLLVFYGVGTIGIYLNPTQFAKLTPFNLLITTFILFYLHPKKDLLFFINLFMVGISAWFLEMIGVTTGLIFGNYQYGLSLGPKLTETPLIIGLNWIIVAYSSLQTIQFITIKLNKKLSEIAASLCAALLMVLLDFLIEPLAPKLDFWTFQNNFIPLQNYTAWFFFGFAFCFWMLKGGLLKNNPMGWRVYLVQILFFSLLTLFL